MNNITNSYLPYAPTSTATTSRKTGGPLQTFFFRNICKPDNCLHHLLPPPRDLAVTSRTCISKTKTPNKKILLSSVLCSFKFPITMACFYVTFAIVGFLLFALFVVFCSLLYLNL